MILDELKKLGYIDVHPLEKIVYTDGITYEFPKGMYFACYKETDTESTIFNSDLKKLGRKSKGQVSLRIKNTVSDTTEWSVRRESKMTHVTQDFNTKRLRAALLARDAGNHIDENCGIFPVFKYAPPSSHVSHYEIETKETRDHLILTAKIDIENLEEAWLAIKHPNGGFGGRKNEWEAAQYEVVAMYEMRNTDSAIRYKKTKNILGSDTSTLCGIVGGKRITVGIKRYRAYMYTFMEHKKRDHQDRVDHIDGDHTNNKPWNLRWASTAENLLAIHRERAKRIVPDMAVLREAHGTPSSPKMWNGWTFHSNMYITRPDKTEFVARSTTGTYPVIQATLKYKNGKIEKRMIKCHLIVAFLHRIPSSDRASIHLETLGKSRTHFQMFDGTYFDYAQELKSCGLVIMHDDNDKTNYCVLNLSVGTPSENAHARHANPETTSRKRVDIMDPETRKRIRTFDSYTQAAEWLELTMPAVSGAVRFNRTREARSYRATKHKSTGAIYHVVDA